MCTKSVKCMVTTQLISGFTISATQNVSSVCSEMTSHSVNITKTHPSCIQIFRKLYIEIFIELFYIRKVFKKFAEKCHHILIL